MVHDPVVSSKKIIKELADSLREVIELCHDFAEWPEVLERAENALRKAEKVK